MNIIKKQDGQVFRLESYWNHHNDDSHMDSNGQKFPYPKNETNWSGKDQFLERLNVVNKELLKQGNYREKKSIDCLLCNKKKVTMGDFSLNNTIWEDGLTHYIESHNTRPSSDFQELIYGFQTKNNNSRVLKVDGTLYKMDDLKYIKLDRNQIMIMDALMKHGGYKKKYIDPKNKNLFRYSEHAGLIDFNNDTVEKIIISGRTNRVDQGDDEIYLPKNIPEAFDYEYIFHTHPPTPKPGGRVNIGILYEFPSISDIFHFIDHYNDGNTQGSLVVTPEGLYNIRPLRFNKKKIKINEDSLYKNLSTLMHKLQSDAITKHGNDFSTHIFYSKIAQDLTFINSINDLLKKYNLHIDFFPREKDYLGNWIIETLHLPIFVTEPIH